ncbi:uncharacterized protein DNG_05663 [Cephalotrichum gorgonifer]|uniref:Uncharacterized protein n=1 Tax=Cephalotrichum gorgonifer TaxID=2041049 RepID=A0AAE8N1C0_9PEZI|nr:uncharacterized protein DNG_05663 [Cephalotrichum gorgonifer]
MQTASEHLKGNMFYFLKTSAFLLLLGVDQSAASALRQTPTQPHEALLGPVLPTGYNEPEQHDNTTWGSLRMLFKRNCVFDDRPGAGNYCSGDNALCCYHMKPSDGGFCCGGEDFGSCCGAACCPKGFYCAYADETTSSCCADGDSCGGIPQQTQAPASTTVVTKLITTVEDGTTITRTSTDATEAGGHVPDKTDGSAPIETGGEGSNPARESGSGGSDKAVIVGGVLGGAALAVIVAALAFIGSRRGWFRKVPTVGSPVPVPAVEQKPAEQVPSHLAHRNFHAQPYSYDGGPAAQLVGTPRAEMPGSEMR